MSGRTRLWLALIALALIVLAVGGWIAGWLAGPAETAGPRAVRA